MVDFARFTEEIHIQIAFIERYSSSVLDYKMGPIRSVHTVYDSWDAFSTVHDLNTGSGVKRAVGRRVPGSSKRMFLEISTSQLSCNRTDCRKQTWKKN